MAGTDYRLSADLNALQNVTGANLKGYHDLQHEERVSAFKKRYSLVGKLTGLNPSDLSESGDAISEKDRNTPDPHSEQTTASSDSM